MTWVSSQVPEEYVVKEFPACFQNGVLLCALIEKIVPGACPRFDLLDPDQSLRNLKLAFHLIEKHFKIKSVSFCYILVIARFTFLYFELAFPKQNICILILIFNQCAYILSISSKKKKKKSPFALM